MTETQDLLKDLFKNLDEMQEYLMPILLPHITEFRKNLFNYCSCGYQINVLQSVLKEFHKEGWLPIDKLLFHCRVSPRNTERQFLLFYYADLFKANFGNEYDGKELFCDNTIQELTYPYLKAALFMMAAFGFVEIAYKEKPDEGATSYYDTLAYVRLTNLGFYALDIKKRCKPMKAPKKKYSLLQIPTDDKELQHIILTDPTIRKYTLKAEGFILLVETNFKNKVVEALKKYGYLI